jgi:hypothetical protein
MLAWIDNQDSFLDQERDRLRAHFAWVVEILKVQPTVGLTAAVRATRARLIEALEAYARRGVFPRNPLSDRMAPTFVDSGGRECAVAHLMLATGDRGLVEMLTSTKNLEHVAGMLGPDLDRWAAAAGLSPWEVALIQPDYCPHTSEPCKQWVTDDCGIPPVNCMCELRNKSDGASCENDNNVCTLETCESGICVRGKESRSCDDEDPSTLDTCDAKMGCISAKVLLPGGEPGDETDTSEGGCSNAGVVPDGSLAPVLAGLFLLAVRRRSRPRR